MENELDRLAHAVGVALATNENSRYQIPYRCENLSLAEKYPDTMPLENDDNWTPYSYCEEDEYYKLTGYTGKPAADLKYRDIISSKRMSDIAKIKPIVQTAVYDFLLDSELGEAIIPYRVGVSPGDSRPFVTPEL